MLLSPTGSAVFAILSSLLLDWRMYVDVSRFGFVEFLVCTVIFAVLVLFIHVLSFCFQGRRVALMLVRVAVMMMMINLCL